MAVVYIPAALRSLTAGETRVTVPAESLRDLFDRLDEIYPGLKGRLLDGERLTAGMAVFVDGTIPATGLRTKLAPNAEIHFAPAIAGG
jgi:molybdopterin synthase sulfur carrier subunit